MHLHISIIKKTLMNSKSISSKFIHEYLKLDGLDKIFIKKQREKLKQMSSTMCIQEKIIYKNIVELIYYVSNIMLNLYIKRVWRVQRIWSVIFKLLNYNHYKLHNFLLFFDELLNDI
jgi:hypothetical protein